MSDSSFNLDEFRLRPDPVITRLYRDHRTAFVRWAKGRSTITDDDALADIFQDAILILWKNVQSGRLTELTASITTYLYGIGRNLLLERSRRPQMLSLPDNAQLPDNFNGIAMSAEHEMIREEEHQQLNRALEQMGEPCTSILKLTYYEALKSDQIAAAMNYSTADVVRQQRKRCMDKIRDILKKK